MNFWSDQKYLRARPLVFRDRKESRSSSARRFNRGERDLSLFEVTSAISARVPNTRFELLLTNLTWYSPGAVMLKSFSIKIVSVRIRPAEDHSCYHPLARIELLLAKSVSRTLGLHGIHSGDGARTSIM
jgi:hypothetical protein